MSTIYTSNCLIKSIPSMCSGASGAFGAAADTPSLHESGAVVYDPGAAEYAIGKLKTHIPGYNPAYATLAPYQFDCATISGAAAVSTWVPTIYTNVSGGSYTSAIDGSAGVAVCADNSYNVADSDYTVVTWNDLLGDTDAQRWLGGGGLCSGGSWGFVAPGAGITSPPSEINTVQLMASVNAAPGPLGGGGESSGGACDIFIGVVTNAPAGGFGAGTVKKVTFNTDGTYSLTGNDVSVVFPYV